MGPPRFSRWCAHVAGGPLHLVAALGRRLSGLRATPQQLSEAVERTQQFYERRQTFITVTATLASCLAAWWTYVARAHHNRQIEGTTPHSARPSSPPSILTQRRGQSASGPFTPTCSGLRRLRSTRKPASTSCRSLVWAFLSSLGSAWGSFWVVGTAARGAPPPPPRWLPRGHTSTLDFHQVRRRPPRRRNIRCSGTRSPTPGRSAPEAAVCIFETVL